MKLNEFLNEWKNYSGYRRYGDYRDYKPTRILPDWERYLKGTNQWDTGDYEPDYKMPFNLTDDKGNLLSVDDAIAEYWERVNKQKEERNKKREEQKATAEKIIAKKQASSENKSGPVVLDVSDKTRYRFKHTEKATLVVQKIGDETTQAWLPKSQIKVDSIAHTITIPRWLFNKTGLVEQ
jgi:hypothetical protein